MVKIDRAVNGLAAFIEAKIFPLLNLKERAGITAALVYMRLKPVKALDFALMAVIPNASPDSVMRSIGTLGLIDSDYNLDIDTLIEIAKETARKCGKLEINFLGYGFALEESHFDALKSFIEKAE